MSISEIIRTLATAATAGITRLTRMVSKDFNQEFVLSLLELIDDSIVKGILVLLKPSSNVVTDLFRNANSFLALPEE